MELEDPLQSVPGFQVQAGGGGGWGTQGRLALLCVPGHLPLPFWTQHRKSLDDSASPGPSLREIKSQSGCWGENTS